MAEENTTTFSPGDKIEVIGLFGGPATIISIGGDTALVRWVGVARYGQIEYVLVENIRPR